MLRTESDPRPISTANRFETTTPARVVVVHSNVAEHVESASVRDWTTVGEIVLIAAASALLLFTRLDYPLLEPDEGRYAEIPRLMMRTGEYGVPMLQGKPYNDKPPLLYWATAASYHCFGVSEWSARFPSVLSTWLTILGCFLWTRKQLGRSAAWATVAVLTTMFGFILMGRMLLTDSMLALFVLAALWCGQTAMTAKRGPWAWWLTAGCMAGLGVLAKGPVAYVLTVPALFAYRWLEANAARPRVRDWLAFGAVSLAVAAPWFIWISQVNPTFLGDFFWRHHFRRFTDPFHHPQPWWYYLPVLALELLPWTPLAILAVVWMWKQRRQLPGPVKFACLTIVWGFVFFSTAGAKLPTYLMPLLPLIAIIIGYFISNARATSIRPIEQWLRRTLVLTGIVTAVVIWWAQWQGASTTATIATILILTAGLALLANLSRMKPLFRQMIPTAVAFAIIACWAWHLIPNHAMNASVGILARDFALWAEREGMPVTGYRNLWDAAGFYGGAEEFEAFSSREDAAFFEFLRKNRRTLVLMRGDTEDRHAELAARLPADLIIERVIERGPVTAFVVGRR